ncbi:MAG: metallophosphoesterase [Spirochaetaceae bacterium]|nr:metallophosphoesterase [Spirochaetaceae bacterium]
MFYDQYDNPVPERQRRARGELLRVFLPGRAGIHLVIRLFCSCLLFPLSLAACSVDLLGFFGSNDLDERLNHRNTFNLLSPSDRNLTFTDDSYSFIAVADTHIENADAFGLERLAPLVAGDHRVKFVVVLGDITQNGRARDLEKFISIAQSLGVPCYPVVGNHDIYHNNWPAWRDLIGSTSYRIDGYNLTLFVLDSANAFFGASQLSWLDRELGTAKGRVFVFTHANLFTESVTDIQVLTDLRERARIMSLLQGRVDGMISGHAHKRIIKTRGAVRYTAVEDFKSTKTYCRVEVGPGGVSYTFAAL